MGFHDVDLINCVSGRRENKAVVKKGGGAPSSVIDGTSRALDFNVLVSSHVLVQIKGFGPPYE